MSRLELFFPKSHGKPRVDDRRGLSRIIFINRDGLRWCDAPKEYGPQAPPHPLGALERGGGVFARILIGLAADAPEEKAVSIDATYLETHRTAPSLRLKKGAWAPVLETIGKIAGDMRRAVVTEQPWLGDDGFAVTA